MPNSFYRFLRFYNKLLHRYKYPVQIATGGLLWCAGDVLAQGAVHLGKSREADDGGDGRMKVDWERTGKMTMYGLCFSAPAYAFWYSFLDRASLAAFRHAPTPTCTTPIPHNIFTRPLLSRLSSAPVRDGATHVSSEMVRTWKIIGFKLAADTLLFDPVYLSLFFTATGYMEGKRWPEISEKLKKDLLPTYLIDIFLWAPVQTANFRFVPVAYQALIVQSCNVAWNAYLSYVQHRDDTHTKSLT